MIAADRIYAVSDRKSQVLINLQRVTASSNISEREQTLCSVSQIQTFLVIASICLAQISECRGNSRIHE
jgi:hypothetical protein